jgi:general secretion pathway protein C
VAGFSVAYWVLRWMGQSPVTPVPVSVPALQPVDTHAVARALGAQRAAAPATTAVQASSRYSLAGVVAPAATGRSSPVAEGSGVALIAVDGQRPSPYRVGAVLDGRWKVHSVERRSVVLRPVQGAGDGPATTLTLPGVLP